jgi:mannitol-specific phosphotransferase system IIBC component
MRWAFGVYSEFDLRVLCATLVSFVVNALILLHYKAHKAHQDLNYCAAFTSFQISLYLARRGTFCQK